MKIKLSELRQIIREELRYIVEGDGWGSPPQDDTEYLYFEEQDEEELGEYSPRRWDGADPLEKKPSKK